MELPPPILSNTLADRRTPPCTDSCVCSCCGKRELHCDDAFLPGFVNVLWVEVIKQAWNVLFSSLFTEGVKQQKGLRCRRHPLLIQNTIKAFSAVAVALWPTDITSNCLLYLNPAAPKTNWTCKGCFWYIFTPWSQSNLCKLKWDTGLLLYCSFMDTISWWDLHSNHFTHLEKFPSEYFSGLDNCRALGFGQFSPGGVNAQSDSDAGQEVNSGSSKY